MAGMNDISLNHLLDVAICAAEAAGKHAMANLGRRKEATAVFDHDIKLVLDIECQEVAERIIASEFPDHAILGEERASPNPAASFEWIIDPIDGTMNFSHGMEYWCSSVAVRSNRKVVAGCVYAPVFDAFYTAHIEQEARRNGMPIRVSGTRHLQDALVVTGLSKLMQASREPHLDLFRMLANNTKKVRINGAAALDLCRVADGTADGFLETDIHLWDYAAAGLIAEQAGATLALYPRKDEANAATVLCANPHLIDGLRAIYTKCV